jgi:transposase-like protein
MNQQKEFTLTRIVQKRNRNLNGIGVGNMKTARYTIKEFNEQFPNDDTCLEFVFHARYNDKVYCEICQKITNHYRRTGRKSYACEFCGNEIFPTAGTIFHKSPTPLRSWFYAMFLMSQTRCGISAKQLERELGVTYKTAWRMFKQIRSLMDEKSGKMNGRIEFEAILLVERGYLPR